ncbi:MAG: cofactor-independent phosphoglycerate mutase [Methermicoccaceae archaeon]
MKYAILVGDGMGDYALEEYSSKTPLEIASTPNMDEIAKKGVCGLASTIPPGFPIGRGVANMSILGYDPTQYYTGRGALEAAGLDIPLSPGDVAFRCNLITVYNGRIVDYSAGHITTEEARPLIEAVNAELGGDVRFHLGVGYRHIMVAPFGADVICTPPHEVINEQMQAHLPRGPDSERLIDLIKRSAEVIENTKEEHIKQVQATHIWLWGQGKSIHLPTYQERFSRRGYVICAVSLIKGLGRLAGLKPVEVPRATGFLDTNYEGKADAALRYLEEGDFVLVHVEAPDEASHLGDLEAKLKAIEAFDSLVVGKILDGMQKFDEEFRILLMPDHYTPVSLRVHTDEPVPFAIMGKGKDDVQSFSERACAKGAMGRMKAHMLADILMER